MPRCVHHFLITKLCRLLKSTSHAWNRTPHSNNIGDGVINGDWVPVCISNFVCDVATLLDFINIATLLHSMLYRRYFAVRTSAMLTLLALVAVLQLPAVSSVIHQMAIAQSRLRFILVFLSEVVFNLCVKRFCCFQGLYRSWKSMESP